VLLKVAGWTAVKTMMGIEPWFIGSIFGLFLLGRLDDQGFRGHGRGRTGGVSDAADRLRGTQGGVVDFAVVRVPFVLIGAGAWLGILTGHHALLYALSAILTA